MKKKEKLSSSERNRKRRRNQQMVVLSRLTGSFVSGNIYQTCRYQVLCIWFFAAKCTGGKQFTCNLHVNQNMNYVREDSDKNQFEEYTIVTYQVSAVEQKKV